MQFSGSFLFTCLLLTIRSFRSSMLKSPPKISFVFIKRYYQGRIIYTQMSSPTVPFAVSKKFSGCAMAYFVYRHVAYVAHIALEANYFDDRHKWNDFIIWNKTVLEHRLFFKELSLTQSEAGLWRIDTANQQNILKLLTLVYDIPYGMQRKYNLLREMFRDYNKDNLLLG